MIEMMKASNTRRPVAAGFRCSALAECVPHDKRSTGARGSSGSAWVDLRLLPGPDQVNSQDEAYLVRSQAPSTFPGLEWKAEKYKGITLRTEEEVAVLRVSPMSIGTRTLEGLSANYCT